MSHPPFAILFFIMFREWWEAREERNRQARLDKLIKTVEESDNQRDANNTFDANQLRKPLDLAHTIIKFGEAKGTAIFIPGSTPGDPDKRYLPTKDTPTDSYEMKSVFDSNTGDYQGFSIRHHDYSGGYGQDPPVEQISFRQDGERWVVDDTKYTETEIHIAPRAERPKRSEKLLKRYWNLLQGEDEE